MWSFNNKWDCKYMGNTLRVGMGWVEVGWTSIYRSTLGGDLLHVF